MSNNQQSAVKEFVQTRTNRNLFLEERAIMRITDLIESVMESQSISRSELASRLGKSRGWITQLLDGDSNKTIRTVAGVLAELDQELDFQVKDISIGKPKPLQLKIYSGITEYGNDRQIASWNPAENTVVEQVKIG